MKYILKPSLEHIAAVVVAITLWNQSDVRASITKASFLLLATEKRKKWNSIEKRVIRKVQKLPQPELLKEKISGFVKPIGLEILKWIEFHCAGFYLHIDPPSRFCWTSHGTIDRKKTAEMLVKSDSLDCTMRYKLACIYCLEDDIRELWNKTPVDCRRSLTYEDYPGEVSQQDIVFFWTCEMKLEDAGMKNRIPNRLMLRRSYSRAFEYAAVSGSKAAVEHFFRKLTQREREESLVDIAKRIIGCHHTFHSNSIYIPKEDYTGVLYFLLSQMNEEQEKELFKKCRSQVLALFLDWPWQNFFIETSCRMWDFLSVGDYYGLASEIIGKIRKGYKDFNYQNLFEEFWRKIPEADRKDVIGKPSGECLLSFLLEIKDEKIVKLIFQDLTLEEKRKLFICSGNNICENLVFSDDLSLLKFFIQECEPPEYAILKFKDDFKEHMSLCFSKDELVKNKDKLDKFFQLLDNFGCDQGRAERGHSS